MLTRYSLLEQRPATQHLNILLAEDNPVNQKLAIRLLQKRGHTVTVANNGREALDASEKTAFDLVIMDVQMPEMDGLEATIELRRREQSSGGHMPIIAMTALTMKGDKERCLEAGMDGYLSKPIRPEELDDVLDSYTGKKKVEAIPVEDPEWIDCVNMEELLERVDGDRTLIAELADIYREAYPRQIQTLREGVTSMDADKIRGAAHALKGALSNLSATQASSLAASLEAIGYSKDLAGAASLVDQLDNAVQLVDRQLHSICPELVG